MNSKESFTKYSKKCKFHLQDDTHRCYCDLYEKRLNCCLVLCGPYKGEEVEE